MSQRFVYKLTPSQRMTIIDILLIHARSKEPQMFLDVLRDETTHTGDLLTLFASTEHIEQPARPASPASAQTIH